MGGETESTVTEWTDGIKYWNVKNIHHLIQFYSKRCFCGGKILYESTEAKKNLSTDKQEIKIIVDNFQSLGFAISGCLTNRKLNVIKLPGKGKNIRLMCNNCGIHKAKVTAAGSIG